MSDPEITLLLEQVERGDELASERLLPLVYDELRRLAAARMSGEAAGHTLQPTALVHEAYLRLIEPSQTMSWNGRGHFFAAAAKAMRRILVEHARQKQSLKRGGDRLHQSLDSADLPFPSTVAQEDLLALDDALEKLAESEPLAVRIVELRFFAGFSSKDAANLLSVSPRKADMLWAFARAWLRKQLEVDSTTDCP